MSLKIAFGRLVIVGLLSLAAVSSVYADSLSSEVNGDDGAMMHPLMVEGGEQVEITLKQVPAEGAGCLPGSVLQMFVYQADKIVKGPSAETGACTHHLAYMSPSDGTVDLVVHNFSTDPVVKVKYALEIDGATTKAAMEETTMEATAAPMEEAPKVKDLGFGRLH